MYVSGMLFNQLAGYTIKFLSKIRVITPSKKLREIAFSDLNTDYHGALQFVISKSSDAYAYLSYRRSIIRIYRTLLISMLFLSCTLIISHPTPRFQIDTKTVVALCSFAVAIFSGIVFTKNLQGYYSAIANFYRHFTEEK